MPLHPQTTEHVTQYPNKIFHTASKKNNLVVVGLAGIKGSLHFIQRHLTIQLLIMGQIQSEQSGAFSELFSARILDQSICQSVVLLEGR